MTLSNLTPFDFIAEGSEATPGAFNRIFSQLSDNLGSTAAGVSFSQLSNVTQGFGYFQQGVAIGSYPPSQTTTAGLQIGVNSNQSDYLYLTDSSAQRSNYIIGSRAGGTADGLNIWDASGATMIVTFSKQSVRFWQSVVGPVFDIGGSVANVRGFGAKADGVTDDANAMQAALDSGEPNIYVPSGTYLVKSNLSIPNNTRIFGDGYHSHIIADPTLGNAVIRNKHWPTGNQNIAIEHLRFDGAANSMASSGAFSMPPLEILSCTSVFVDTVWVEHGTDWGLSFSSCSEAHVRNIFVNNNGDGAPGGVDGIHFLDCMMCTLDGAHILSGDDCVGVTSQYRDVHDIVIRNILGQSVAANGVIFNEESTTTKSISSVFVYNLSYYGTGNAVRYRSINSSGNTSLFRNAQFSNIYGNQVTDSVIRLSNVNNVQVTNVFSPQCNTHAVDCQLSQGVSLYNIHTQSAGSAPTDNGVNISSCTDVKINSVFAQKSAVWGLQIFGSSRVHASGIVAVGCGRSGTGQERGGIRLHNCTDVVLSDAMAIDDGGGNNATGLRITGTASRVWVAPDCHFSGLSSAVIDSPGIEVATFPTLHALSEESLGFYRSAASTLLLSYGTLGLSRLSIDGSSIVQVGGRRFLQGGNAGDQSNYLYSGGAGGVRFINQGDTVQILGITDAGQIQAITGTAIFPPYAFVSEASLGLYRSGNSTLDLSYGTFKAPAIWATSGISIGNATAGGSLIPAISSTSSKVAAFVVQGSSSSFTRIVWAAAQPGDQILVTVQPDAAVSSMSSGLVAHSHCTQAGQIEFRLSNVSTLAQNQSSKTWYFTRVSPF